MQSPIRVVVMGIGNRGVWALRTLLAMPDFNVVAMIDPIAARLACIRSELSLPDTVRDFASLSDCLAGTELDAVAIFTPDGTHAEQVVQALEAGKRVFVEKPLDITEERLAQIVEADRKAGGRTFVGFNLRYAPVYRTIKDLIDAGELGELLTIQADEYYDGGRTYFRRWHRLRAGGGGLWITKACHDFDLLYWLAGAQPTSVYAHSALTYYRPRPDAAMYCRDCGLRADCPDRYDLHVESGSLLHRINEVTEAATGQRADLCLFNSEKDTFDHGQAIVTFANGVTGTYTVNVVTGFTNRRIRVAGTKAVVDGNLEEGTVHVRRRDPANEEHLTLGSGFMHGGADNHVMQAFSSFVRGQHASIVRPVEAVVAVRVGLAATRSSDERRVISLR